MKIFEPELLKGQKCFAFYMNVLGIEINNGEDEHILSITFIPMQNKCLQRFKVSNDNIGIKLIKFLKQNQGVIIKKLYIKHFGELYDNLITSNPHELTEYCIFSSGTFGGLAWYYPRFLNFLKDLQMILNKIIKEV